MGRRLEALEQFGIDVVLERRRGFRAAILRALLRALSFVYERIVQFRLWLYRKRIWREHSLGCLVISIGNLTATSDKNGYFVIEIPPEQQRREQTLVASKDGYKICETFVYPESPAGVEILLEKKGK